jgi:hypothetical protein
LTERRFAIGLSRSEIWAVLAVFPSKVGWKSALRAKISNPSAAGRVAGPNNFLESSERSVIIGPVVVAAEAKARYSVVRGTSP